MISSSGGLVRWLAYGAVNTWLCCVVVSTRPHMLAGCMQVAVITELCEGGSLFHTLRHHGVCGWPWCALPLAWHGRVVALLD